MEHAFTAAVRSCFMTPFLSVAENSKLVFTHVSCQSKGKLDFVEGKYKITEVILETVVTIRDAQDRERALRVLQKSEAACLISNSIQSKVTMFPAILVDAVQ
ncbi:MAG: OsmC family protein [Chitinophagia bacterium]